MASRRTGTKPLSDQILNVFQYYVLFYLSNVVATTYISGEGHDELVIGQCTLYFRMKICYWNILFVVQRIQTKSDKNRMWCFDLAVIRFILYVGKKSHGPKNISLCILAGLLGENQRSTEYFRNNHMSWFTNAFLCLYIAYCFGALFDTMQNTNSKTYWL